MAAEKSIKQLLEAFETNHLIVEDFIPAGCVRHRGVEREADRIQLENNKNNKERGYKQVAVLIIADGFALGFRGKLRARRDLLHISTPLA